MSLPLVMPFGGITPAIMEIIRVKVAAKLPEIDLSQPTGTAK